MQPVSELPDLRLNETRGTNNRSSVENSSAGSDLFNCCRVATGMVPEGLHPVPIGILPRRHRLADARRAVAEADVAVALARITELCESAVFEGFHYGGARRVATRFCIA